MNTIIRLNKMVGKSASCIKSFKELGEFDYKTGISRLVCTEEFVGKYSCLAFGNGGGWSRFDNIFGNHYKAITYKKNKELRYSWEPTTDEIEEISSDINKYLKDNNHTNLKGNNLFLIKIYGYQNENYQRPIYIRIKNYYNKKPCVACGSNHKIEVDHKNGLYNDKRVLSMKTQTFDDFQSLCKHCNLQKRNTMTKTKYTNKRYPASEIPHLKALNIDFTSGDENYDPKDKNAMVGTYWYDPIDFMKKVMMIKKKETIMAMKGADVKVVDKVIVKKEIDIKIITKKEVVDKVIVKKEINNKIITKKEIVDKVITMEEIIDNLFMKMKLDFIE